jgi:hypothetical protein
VKDALVVVAFFVVVDEVRKPHRATVFAVKAAVAVLLCVEFAGCSAGEISDF